MNKQSSDSGPRPGTKSRSATAVIEQEAPTTPEHTSRDSRDVDQNLEGMDQVTLCFFGEAAVNQGAFHESLNMAQLWKLPCIYICENNQYGMGTSLERAMSFQDIAQKARAYEIAAEHVDGMDVLAVRAATERAVERARKQSLPTLLEVRTYRFMGHSMSDPGKYRTRAEIEKYQERDPLKLFSETLKENGIVNEN